MRDTKFYRKMDAIDRFFENKAKKTYYYSGYKVYEIDHDGIRRMFATPVSSKHGKLGLVYEVLVVDGEIIKKSKGYHRLEDIPIHSYQHSLF